MSKIINIAILGRPNVGKSTLFNRLVGRKIALVDDMPGLTRDRRLHDIKIGKYEAVVIDTAGFEEADETSIQHRMKEQTIKAVEQAEICLFLIDARVGVTSYDEELANLLRKTNKKIYLLANKSEGKKGDAGQYEAFSLGLGEPIAISGEQGFGLDELFEIIEEYIDDKLAKKFELISFNDDEDDENRPLKITVIGRPNAGKSTLINSLLGEDRLLVGEEAGITRDTITVPLTWKGVDINIQDTAGLRKKAKVNSKIEKISTAQTIENTKFAEIVILLIDAQKALDKQDLKLADLIHNEGRAAIIAINKWDLISKENQKKYIKHLNERVEEWLPQLRGIPVVTISALTKHNTANLLQSIKKVYGYWNKRINTSELNQMLKEVTALHPPPSFQRGKHKLRAKIRYITQIKSRPPTFVAFSPQPKSIPTSYQRYIVNSIREHFAIQAVPIRLHIKRGKR